MNEHYSSIGPLMKAARKFKKLNQASVAQAIGCSQSALSKMEHNLLVPNAPQWFLFARFTSIPPETIEVGVIDRHSKVILNNDAISIGFKLPRRYRLNRAQKVREIYPFLFYLEKKINGEAFPQFSEKVGIDPEFFLDFDNLVNFQLVIDLINLYVKLGKTSEREIREIVEFGQNDLYWDKFEEDWVNFKSPKDLLHEFCRQQIYLQGDFHVLMEDQKEASIITYRPEPHLYHFLKDVEQETQKWLTQYRLFSLEHLVRKALEMQIEVKQTATLTNSPLESRFEIKWPHS